MTPPGSLQLISIGGPESTTIDIPADRVFTIGRSMKSDFSLAPEAVSRQHAAVQFRGGRWILTDLESRHGTFLNSQQLVPRKPVILGDGDVIGFGPCAYRVSLGERSSTFTSTIVEEPVSSSMRIEPVERGQLDLLARQRLDLLVDCAAQIHGATDEQALAAAVLESALAGTRFHHAALLRPAGGDAIEVIAHKQLDGPASTELQFSRSLIRKAATGQVVRLTEAAAQIPTSMSIAALGITSALCAPITLGNVITGYLYLDARGDAQGDAKRPQDAAGFCQVIARLCGLALSNLKRQELERRQLVLDADIAAARQAQLLIVPASEGVCGPLRYAMQMRPGHFVAGDLFDVIQIDEDRSAVCIGDVTGEGVGAAVIMAATQGHLHGALLRSGDPAAAVNDANRYIASRTAANKFVSLWVGVFDVRQQRLTYVDAGHGYWYFTGSTRPTEDGGRGIPAGIESDYHYDSAELPLACGDRVIMYSDGLVEQRSPSGEPFGQSRVEQSVSTSSSPSEDIERMITSIESFAGRADFDDDTTVASVEVMR